MRPINVLAAPAHYILEDRLGSEYYWSYKLMASLAPHNVRFTALTKVPAQLKDKLDNIELIPLTRTQRLQLRNINKLAFVFNYYLKARRLLKSSHFDIIHHILPFGYEQTFNLLPLLGYTKNIPFVIGPVQIPLSYVSKDEYVIMSRRGFQSTHKRIVEASERVGLSLFAPILRVFSRKTLEKCDCLVVVNEATKKLYSKYVNLNKIKIIPPGIDTEEFQYFPPKPKKKVEILNVGYLIRRKGIRYLIEALPHILKKESNVILRIIGDGPERNALERLTTELHLEEKVVFQKFIPYYKIASFYQNCDIFCLSSLGESFGNVILEAMACGRPVVATQTIGAEGIVEKGKTGFLVPTRDPVALSKALLDLIENRELRLKMGENGRKIIERKYSWKIIAKKYYQVYLNLLNRGH